jgi:hypothetical protein
MAKFINNKVVSIYGDNSDVSLCTSVVVCASEPGTTNRVDRIYMSSYLCYQFDSSSTSSREVHPAANNLGRICYNMGYCLYEIYK